MLIREVILENFMSYEYARIPLKQGVNVVCGPNGSGKSSLLLGICVALGDTYTERSKRLSDLIRWDAESARVTLLLNNAVQENGYRPVPQYNMDEITLTRTLRRDGKYGFRLNQRNVSKAEVVDLLRSFGFDPNNMLIIMHQEMPTRFANISPQERLKTLEEAVGFESFRRDVVEAKSKLSGILSEEESLNQLLNQARDTLAYWREQNERLREKRQLQKRQTFLQQEMAWSRVLALEAVVQRLQDELGDTERDLSSAEEEMERNTQRIVDAESMLGAMRNQWDDLIEKRIGSERLVGVSEHGINASKDQLTQVERIIQSSREQRRRFESAIKTLLDKAQSGPTTLDDYFTLFTEIEETQTQTYDNLSNEFLGQRNTLQAEITSFTGRLTEAEQEASRLAREMEAVRKRIDDTNDQYIEGRIQLALLKDRRGRLRRRTEQVKAEIDRTTRDLRDAEAEALIRGPRIETGRSGEDILNEIRRTQGILMGMADVPEEAEDMYETYNETFREIQRRIEEVKESRRQVLEEIEKRNRKWREVTENLLEEVNVRYKRLLAKLQAVGETRLVNSHDIEDAGLEIIVGFNGAAPQRLDPYTHSGGERSSSVMAFLLALQQNVLSPFRAVDEFDLHMDPQNKEAVSEFIVSTMEGTDDQYMAITPSQITFKGQDVHIIMVHKTDDVSVPRLVEEER
ncbi:MAG TPA: AAA family ATPase [Candidatus Krumholzibacteriaceae bacterium]|nr:AAA family ATPase [Candidatus Krumholzibacteriaceae bacterium]